MMKSPVKLLFLFLIALQSTSLLANFQQPNNDEKVYVEFSRLSFSEDGIFYEIEDGNYIELPILNFDKSGYSFPSGLFCNMSGVVWDYWRCSKGHLNPPWSFRCGVPDCGERRYGT